MNSELRMHPRMPVRLPAEVMFSDEDSVEVEVLNLSLGGLMVESDEAGYRLVEKYKPRFPIEVEIHFGLNQQPVHCHCRLVHVQRQKQNQYCLGFRVLSLNSQAQALITEAVSEYASVHRVC